MRRSLLMLSALVVGACAVLALATSALANGKDLAILVVGRSTDKEMAARERAMVNQLTRVRTQKGYSHKTLPIYSYHFDKNVERAYCEERLKVKTGDLVVVGLVELESGVPVRFIQRDNAVRDVVVVAAGLMDRAEKELVARGVQPTKVATAPPAAPTTKPATTTVTVAPPATKPTVTVAPPSTTAPVTVTPPPAPTTKPAADKPTDKPVAINPASTPQPDVNTKPNGTIVVGPATPPASVDGERFAVQLGLFSSIDKARLVADQARAEGLTVEIRKDVKDGAVVYRVLTGSFNTKADAWARAKELKEAGRDGFAIRVDAQMWTVVP